MTRVCLHCAGRALGFPRPGMFLFAGHYPWVWLPTRNMLWTWTPAVGDHTESRQLDSAGTRGTHFLMLYRLAAGGPSAHWQHLMPLSSRPSLLSFLVVARSLGSSTPLSLQLKRAPDKQPDSGLDRQLKTVFLGPWAERMVLAGERRPESPCQDR